MSKKIILFPFGGNAKESLISLFAINRSRREWDIVGFIDDNPAMKGRDCCGVKVLGARGLLAKYPDAQVLAVPGSPDTYAQRKEVIDGLGIKDSRYATVIDPTVTVAPDASIGYNTLVMPHVAISCGVKIGNHCIILPNTVVSHDSVIGDYCCVGSNVSISGYVATGPMSYIGSGSKIREGVSIGRRVLIGLGSSVVSDIEDGVIAAGNPARVIRKAV